MAVFDSNLRYTYTSTIKTQIDWSQYEIPSPHNILENLPKISIITPSYNQGQYIEETILSVLCQGYPNLEYIIIDGGSTDETVEIIKKYEKWITYWVSEKDEGQSDAINKGLQVATGDIFNWLNSDDLLAPNALWTIGNHFKEKPRTTVLLGYLQTFEDEKTFSQSYKMTIVQDDLPYNMILGGMTQQSLFYRMDTVKKLNGVDIRLYFCMDFDLWCRFIAQFGLNDMAFTPETLAYFRIHSTAKSQLEYQGYDERRSVLLSMLTSMNVSLDYLERLKYNSQRLNFDKVWDFKQTFFNQQSLIAYITELLLVIPHFDYPLSNSIQFWFFSLKNKMTGL